MRMKVMVWAYLVVLSFGTMLNLYMPKTEAAAKESIVIPGEAIRLRILANSDFEKDQAIKRKVRDAVNAQITLWVQDLTSLDKAKTVINDKLPEIQTIAEKVVHDQGSNQSVKVEFGKVQFPTKLYGQFLYPAGQYQAVLITLGKGEGANWWCVLYPPLCFLDFSNGVAVSEGFDENEKSTDEKAKVEEKAAEKSKKKEVTPEKQAVAAVAVSEDQPAKEEPVKGEPAKEKPVAVKADKEVQKTEAPVYTSEDEQPVKVKFFIVEMWHKLFD